MKAKELREMPEIELSVKMQEMHTELMKLYGQVSTGTPPKSPGQITIIRRTIARIKTIRKERKIKKKVSTKPQVPNKETPIANSQSKTSTQAKPAEDIAKA